MGGSIRVIPRISRFPQNARIFQRLQDRRISRDRRRRAIEFGDSELEQRAANVVGTLPERIVYRKLEQLLGAEGPTTFLFQRSQGGGRNILGGYVLDFIVLDRTPPIALEVLGAFWHQPKDRHSDEERGFTMARLGYRYEEVWEQDIYIGDERLEEIITTILGKAI